MKKLKALGITSGIGSMLIGARNAGFNIVGNHEWRKYYHKKDVQGKNTFLENFPKAYFVTNYPQESTTPKDQIGLIDIVLGHP